MFDRVKFVLVEPQFGGNIGSAARAMKNLGFSRLALVGPCCDPRGRDARMMAVDARDVLERAEVHPELEAALAGSRTIVGTSRREGKHRRPHRPLEAVAEKLVGLARAGELAVLFGREDHGLSDSALDRCTHLVHLPAAEAYPSFNLAQAVLLVGYVLRTAACAPAPVDEPTPADHTEREAMYRHLERALVAIGFLSRDTGVVMMRRFRRLLGRADMTPEEVRMLRGVARQTLWLAREAGLVGPEEHDDETRADPETEGRSS